MWNCHCCCSCMLLASFLFFLALAMAALNTCIFMLHQFCVNIIIMVLPKSIPPPSIISPNRMGVSSTPASVRAVMPRLMTNTLAILSAPFTASISISRAMKNHVISSLLFSSVVLIASSTSVPSIVMFILASPPSD